MPEENIENSEQQTPMVDESPEVNADSEKRRIKPVIEEVVSGDTSKDEETSSSDLPQQTISLPPQDLANSLPPDEPKSESKKDIKLFVIISIVTALVVAALAGGIYVYVSGTANKEPVATETPMPTITPNEPEATPEASATPTPKPSSYKIEILNGSGKIGEAGAAKALIEKEGFKVATTGNAATFDFEDTVIEAKKSVPTEVLDTIKEALSSKYSVVIGDNLPTSSSYDIIVTVGSK